MRIVIPYLLFFKKKWQNLKLPYAANYRWRFIGYILHFYYFIAEKYRVIPKYVNLSAPAAEQIRLTLQGRIKEGRSGPLLTLFTTWNDNSEKYLVHNLTIKNWASLRPFVIPVVFTNEPAIANECRKNGWMVHPVKIASNDGFPILKYMFEDVIATYNTTFYEYSNSDILYTNTLIDTLIAIGYRRSAPSIQDDLVQLETLDITQTPVLIVGARFNIENMTEADSATWGQLTSVARNRGEYFVPWAIDYFITSRSYPWKDIPELAIGKPVYDVWLVANARYQNHTVIDSTYTLLAAHQTTRSGNYEGEKRQGTKYNIQVLKNYYKTINLRAGTVECAEYRTQYEAGYIVLTRRFVSDDCTLIN